MVPWSRCTYGDDPVDATLSASYRGLDTKRSDHSETTTQFDAAGRERGDRLGGVNEFELVDVDQLRLPRARAARRRTARREHVRVRPPNGPSSHELGNEERLLVLAGTPTLRHPEGRDGLAVGDMVLFPES